MNICDLHIVLFAQGMMPLTKALIAEVVFAQY